MISNSPQIATIVQRRLTHYRIPLFQKMKSKLADNGVKLRLLVGDPTATEMLKNDGGEISWAEQIPTRYFLSDRICWQPVRRMAKGSDLLIITQENALLANHSLIMRRPSGKLAFWGHGANLQSSSSTNLRERYKRWTTRQVDWWFAYTQMSVDLVAQAGFPNTRITCLNNAIDVNELIADRNSISTKEIERLRQELGMKPGFTGVFIGSLYTHKRLSFLFEAADRIRSSCPSFSLVIIGSGPEESYVRAFSDARPWVQFVGPKRGRDKALNLSLGDVLLNPGLVGLNILDAFACGLPVFTTNCGLHSPEISYLNDRNGIMTADNTDKYVGAILEVFRSPDQLEILKAGSRESAARYSVDAMATHFVAGILEVLRSDVGKTPSRLGTYSE